MQKRVFLKPVITEKSQKGTEKKEYTFLTWPSASKYAVKNTVEEIFGVKVEEVRTRSLRGKERRRGRFYYRAPDEKIAVVRLSEKDKIELFEPEEKVKKGKKRKAKEER